MTLKDMNLGSRGMPGGHITEMQRMAKGLDDHASEAHHPNVLRAAYRAGKPTEGKDGGASDRPGSASSNFRRPCKHPRFLLSLTLVNS